MLKFDKTCFDFFSYCFLLKTRKRWRRFLSSYRFLFQLSPEKRHQQVAITSTTKVGDKIYTVAATDADMFPYNSIKYSISEITDPNLANVASINEKTGEITLVSIPKGYRNMP